MHTPFLDTRNFLPLRLACNMVSYAHHFFMKPANRDLALELTHQDSGVKELVNVLQEAQAVLAPHLPLTGAREVWAARESYFGDVGIETVAAFRVNQSELDSIGSQLNLQLLEIVISRFPTNPLGAPPAVNVVRLACQCVWLSEVLALIVIGVASVRQKPDGSLSVEPASEAQRLHLRRLSFGSAFEKASLVAASAALQVLAEVASNPAKRSMLKDARISALAVFPQHWRLPPDYGPVKELLFDWLEPLLLMIIHCIVASQRNVVSPFGQKDAEAKQITEVYEFVRGVQEGMPFIDQLFQVKPEGLILGTRELAPAAIEMAERFGAHKLGPDWHGNATSDAQKTYLLGRLKGCEHLEVLDFELRQHHTTNRVGLDVDFFVRDKALSQIYAVQLKHLERHAHGGLLAWLALFRENKDSLGNLVRQLENLTSVARSDEKCRAHLVARGLTAAECDRIIPVGIHNVGFVDFWEVQNGVLLYDLSTFANILTDSGGIAVGMTQGRVVNQAIRQPAGPRPSLHLPDSVIDACLLRPSLQHLKSFDLATRLCRQSKVMGTVVIAEGLGI